MNGRWHTDKHVGEVVLLPNGTRVRIASIRGSKVRLEYIDPRREPQINHVAAAAPATPLPAPHTNRDKEAAS